jgi:polygalacturonase
LLRKVFAPSAIVVRVVPVAVLLGACATGGHEPRKDSGPNPAAAATVVPAKPAPVDPPWDQLPAIQAIIKRIVAPTFPERDCDVTKHGAQGDGRSDARAAFGKAIDECAKAGGGRVVVPAGDFLLAGPLYLKSGINLHLQERAVVRFSTNPSDYLPPVLVRWEGTRAHNYSPLIYAYREKNIAITGRGTIDGQAGTEGSGWLELLKLEPARDKSRDALREMGQKGVPVEKRIFGKGSKLRPQLFHAYECENILLHGVTFTGSPFWTLHPAYSRNITVRNVTVKRSHPHRIGNDDGFDPDSSQDVLVEGSHFDTVDDNIAIKSGRDNDAWAGPASENIIVRNSTFAHAHWGGLVIGSEVGGGVRNVYAENLWMGQVGRALYVKSNTDRGGVVENIHVRNVQIAKADRCIMLESTYNDVKDHPHPTPFRNFRFDKVVCDEANHGVISDGLTQSPIRDLHLRNIVIKRAATPLQVANTLPARFEQVKINGQLVPPPVQQAAQSAR